jgi:hypothetical protein
MDTALIKCRIHIILAILCASFGGCVASVSQDGSTTLTEKKLQTLADSIVGWSQVGSSNISSTQWSNLVAVAKVIQTSDPKSVERALHLYQLGGEAETNFDDSLRLADDSKLFLLMRVVFVLPESVPEHDFHFFGGWIGSSGLYNSDGSMNQSWPIKWDNAHPKLMAVYGGIQGINARYDASAEYAFFRKKYFIRDLSSFGKK